ncbi:MAG: GntR family transcriptional regulator [Actinobacteria bacterium HGW-Actinobacteria-6]|jgi:DNA-binding transcriptional MocR family regulator|nr:MAG: GntR family transcriptional regulator [Actinobacteria bacterium HGW-Actinobacteria-6]
MFSERIDRLTSSLVRDILSATQRPGMISFAGGLPAPDELPVPDWSGIPASAAQYGQSEGEPALREAIAEHARSMGIVCDASQVLVVSGSQQGIDLVSKLFIDPGTPIITEAPTYLAALQSFELFGAVCHGVSLGKDGIDADALRTAASATDARLTYVIPTFQNPSGTCYSAETRTAVAAAADDLGLTIFEDDPYRELVYDEVDRTPICAHINRASWIYQSSFSKSFMPGIRVGYLIASPGLMPHLVRLKQATDLHTNRFGQWLAHGHLTSPMLPERLAHLRSAYSAKRDAMEAALREHFGDLAEWTTPPGGLFFWLRLRVPIDTRALLPAMLERGVAFMPGEVFFPATAPSLGYMRLNFSHAGEEQMRSGVAMLAEAVRDTPAL